MSKVSELFYNMLENRQRKESNDFYSTEKEKSDILAKPQAIDNAVANLSSYYSPSGSNAKNKDEMFGIDTVEGSKADDDPTKGVGYKIRDAYTNALANPRYSGVPAGRLLQHAADSVINVPDGSGLSMKEKGYHYTKTEQSRWFGGTPVKETPGYGEWLGDKRAQEKANVDKESWFPEVGSLLETTGIGAGIGAVTGALGGGAAAAGTLATAGAALGTALAPGIGTVLGAGAGALMGAFGGEVIGAAGGALAGAVGGAAAEIIGTPIKKLIHKTDWYQGMAQSNSAIDRGKAMLADMAPFVAVGGMVEGGIQKSIANSKAFKEGVSIIDEANKFTPEITKLIGDGGSGGGSGIVQPGPAPAGSSSPSSLLVGGKSAAWGLQRDPLLKTSLDEIRLAPRTDIMSDVDSSRGTITTTTLDDAFKRSPVDVRTQPGPRPSESENITSLPRSLAWGRQESPMLPKPVEDVSVPRTDIMKDVDLSDASVYKAKIENVIEPGNVQPGPKATPSENITALPRSMAWGRQQKDILDTIEGRSKAVAKITENPTARNIVDNPVPKIEDTKATNPLMDDVANFKDEDLVELGVEDPSKIDPSRGVKKLPGSIVDNIPVVKQNAQFIALGKGDRDLQNKLAMQSMLDARKKNIGTSSDDKLEKDIQATLERVKQRRALEEAEAKKGVTFSDVLDDLDPERKAKADAATRPGEVKTIVSSKVKKEAKDALSSMTDDPIDGIKAADGNLFVDKKGVQVTRDDMKENWFKRNFGEGLNQDEYVAAQKELGIKDSDINTGIEEANKGFSSWLGKQKSFKVVAGMAALGLSLDTMYEMIAPSTVDAGMITNFFKSTATTTAKRAEIAAEALAKGYVAKPIIKETVMGAENFQRGLEHNALKNFGDIASKIKKGMGDGVQYALMSPYQAMESILKTGKDVMINAAPYLASFLSAGATNIKNSTRVVKNILDEASIPIAANQVKKAMEPLIEPAARAAKADVLKVQLSNANKELGELLTKTDIKYQVAHNADIEILRKSIAEMTDKYDPIKTAPKEYYDAIIPIYQKLASEHGSVRVSLALEDPKRELYPWLQLNRQEEIAVGKIRGMLDQYKARLTDRGIATRHDYFPHSPHPEMSKIFNKELEDILGGVPYQKFYSRTESSKMLMPDAHFTMNHYLNDIEQRIQNRDFWKKSGWETIMNSDIVQSNPGLKKAFENLYEGSKPQEHSWGNIAASKYAEIEATKRLFLNPSAGIKHLVKLTGDVMSVGIMPVLKSSPDMTGYMARRIANNIYDVTPAGIKKGLSALGVRSEKFSKTLMDNYTDSIIQTGNIRKYMMDMGIDSQDELFNGIKDKAKSLWRGTQDVGAMWINLAELMDRSVSVNSALQIAAKRGMTVDQALYGTYDLILKNNFLYGQFNPSWLNNPKIRAAFMFQSTPFKIFERRLVNAQRSYDNVKHLSKNIQKVWNESGGKDRLINDVRNMRKYIREGESELKSNLIVDTLRQETDYFGTPVVQQFMRDLLTVGAFTYGGSQVGLHLQDHFFHIPFLSTMSDKGKAELALSPAITKTMEGYNAWKKREDNDDFLLSTIVRKWAGPAGPLPDTFNKALRLNNNDIPEIYRQGGGNSHLKYLFGIPGKE